MDIAKQIATELTIEPWQVEAVITLIDEGNTIPFIARYRKEKHGALNDEQLRTLDERLTYLRNLEERKQAVLKSIEEQEKLTPELKKAIEDAMTLVAVEDLYRPYKQKRRTRATIAKEKGLEGLANIIWLQMVNHPIEEEAKQYLNEEKEVHTVEEAIQGAKDILAEVISDDAQYRTWIRNISWKEGLLTSEAKDKEAESVYEMYYEFQEPVAKMAGYRTLAVNRGEKEKILTVKVVAPEEKIINYLEKQVIVKENPYTTDILKDVCDDSYHRLIADSIERDIRNELTEHAEDGAIEVFGENSVKINGIPDLEYRSKTKNIFMDILDQMISDERTSIKDVEERFIATVACKAAVKAGMDLTKEEVDNLLQNLLKLNNPYTCPHGRPTTIKIGKEYIEKFNR